MNEVDRFNIFRQNERQAFQRVQKSIAIILKEVTEWI